MCQFGLARMTRVVFTLGKKESVRTILPIRIGLGHIPVCQFQQTDCKQSFR
jgi:hypothetical protein